jgi:hypothetical protein
VTYDVYLKTWICLAVKGVSHVYLSNETSLAVCRVYVCRAAVDTISNITTSNVTFLHYRITLQHYEEKSPLLIVIVCGSQKSLLRFVVIALA